MKFAASVNYRILWKIAKFQSPQLGVRSTRRKVMSALDDRYLLRMAVNDRTASFRQLARRWYTATDVFVNSSTFAAPWTACKGAFIQDPLTTKH